MKSITHLFTHEIIIKRLRSTSGHKRAFQSTATVDGHVQERIKEAIPRLGIIEERTFEAWFDIDEDVREGDKIIDHLGREFYVKTATKKDYGVNTHLQCILEKPNE